MLSRNYTGRNSAALWLEKISMNIARVSLWHICFNGPFSSQLCFNFAGVQWKQTCMYIYMTYAMRENYYSKVTHWPVKDPSFLRFFRVPDFYEITIYISQTPRWNPGNPNIGWDPSVFGWTFYLLLKAHFLNLESLIHLLKTHNLSQWSSQGGVLGCLFTYTSGGNIFQRRNLGNWNDTRSSTPQKSYTPKVQQLAPEKCWDWKTINFLLGFGNFSGAFCC